MIDSISDTKDGRGDPGSAASTERLIAITGATGALGRRVALRLAERGVRLRLIVRDADRAPLLPGVQVRQASGFGDLREFTSALRGIDTLFFVPAGPAADRGAQHRGVVDAALAARVSRIVYLSFVGSGLEAESLLGQVHTATERRVRACGLDHTILRSNLHLDQLAAMVDPDGVLRGPTARGRVAAVSRDDVAEVAAAILAEPAAHTGQTYDITGKEAIGLAEAAERMAAASGLPIRYEHEPAAVAYRARRATGAPPWLIQQWISSHAAISAGEFAAVTDTVRRITGRDPHTIEEYLRIHPDGLAHVRPA